MLITRVELQNTKSYRDDTVTFTEGTNAICGENGAGKSTLLEAIGFALFDFLPYTQSDFVREGEKTATITISFVSSQDGREYQVVRRCGGSSDYYIYDPELDGRVANSKADTLEWLKDHLGVEPTTDLAALFRDAVGVPQGLLTAAFLQTPSQRKPIFDRLLRVDEYEQVWKVLRDTLRHLESKIVEHRETIARLESQAARLPGLRHQADRLGAEVVDIETQLDGLKTDLAETTARLESMETTKKELDDLTQKVEMMETRLEGIGGQLAAAENAVAAAEKAQAMLEASQAGHEAYEAAMESLEALEADRKHRDTLRAEQATQEKTLALALERLKHLEESLSEIKTAEAQIETLEPRAKRQEELEATLKTAREHVRRLESALALAGERQGRLDTLQARLAAVESELAEAERIEAELRQTQAQLEEKRQSVTDLKSEQAALAAEAKRLAQQTQTLETTDAADCPVCEQPLTPAHRSDLLRRNRTRLDELQAQEKALIGKIEPGIEIGSELEHQIQNLDTQLRNMPRAADKTDLANQITALEQELSTIQSEAEKLAGSQDEVLRMERELAGLGDPRRQVERLAEKVGQRPDLEEKLDESRQAASVLEERLTEIEGELAPFANLDQRLTEQRAARDKHEADHRRYLENAKIAADLPPRREQVESLRAHQSDLVAKRDNIKAQAEEVAARFDADAFATARRREADLRANYAGLEGQLSRVRQEITAIEGEIRALEAAEQALNVEQVALANLQQVLNLANFFRQVIRDAGPHVTRRLIQQVSLEAARIFAEIMADHTVRLRWQPDYEIVLEKNGRDRSFQQLSGGEQMAAALAVRLALLRELSSIDIAFFDEPTANLDDTRREGLAEQILSVKGFSQLFVISHDDTFERATHNTVRIRKQDGVSRVEVF